VTVAAASLVTSRAGLALGSLALHIAVLGAMLWSAGREVSRARPEQPVALMWEDAAAGAGDRTDSAALPSPPGPPAASAPPPLPDVPPPMPPAPGPAAIAAPPLPAPVPPAPVPPAVVPEVARSAPEARLAAAVPPPPPPPPEPPRRAAEPPPRPATRFQAPGPAAGGGAVEAPLASGEAQASGAVVPPRPAAGAANRSPEYPQASRIRGEQGRVTLLVQVDPAGEVLDLAILGSSGHAALDQAAARTVRGWRFQPATQGGRPVFSTTTLGITFRLDGERRR